jgi:hypothetical protein
MVEKARNNLFKSSSAVAKGAFLWFLHQSKEKHLPSALNLVRILNERLRSCTRQNRYVMGKAMFFPE